MDEYRLKTQPIVRAWLVVTNKELAHIEKREITSPPEWIASNLEYDTEYKHYKLFSNDRTLVTQVHDGCYIVKHKNGFIEVLSRYNFKEKYTLNVYTRSAKG